MGFVKDFVTVCCCLLLEPMELLGSQPNTSKMRRGKLWGSRVRPVSRQRLRRVEDAAFYKRVPANRFIQDSFAKGELVLVDSSDFSVKRVGRVRADQEAVAGKRRCDAKIKFDGGFPVVQLSRRIAKKKVEFADRPLVILNLMTVGDDLKAADVREPEENQPLEIVAHAMARGDGEEVLQCPAVNR